MGLSIVGTISVHEGFSAEAFFISVSSAGEFQQPSLCRPRESMLSCPSPPHASSMPTFSKRQRGRGCFLCLKQAWSYRSLFCDGAAREMHGRPSGVRSFIPAVEVAIMRRWGMADDGTTRLSAPPPSIGILGKTNRLPGWPTIAHLPPTIGLWNLGGCKSSFLVRSFTTGGVVAEELLTDLETLWRQKPSSPSDGLKVCCSRPLRTGK